MKVVYDCDITMGVERCDVDDGLALMYLLGHADIDLLCMTTTFGNSDIDTVNRTAQRVLGQLNVAHKLPLFSGAAKRASRISDASRALVDYVKQYPGQITILATGSLTNLMGAWQIYPDFFNVVKAIVTMGGILHPLIINDRLMNELNFSCDSQAAYHVLASAAPTTVINGHICLQTLFTLDDYHQIFAVATSQAQRKLFDYIKAQTLPWLEYIGQKYQNKGFHNWDAIAAVYLTHPQLFIDKQIAFSATPDDLSQGYLIGTNISARIINVPTTIVDPAKLQATLIESWSNIQL